MSAVYVDATLPLNNETVGSFQRLCNMAPPPPPARLATTSVLLITRALILLDEINALMPNMNHPSLTYSF